ncbi:cell division cycle 42, like [Lates japonicus]|uniref:Cell division cycle 42, like n=1 Tax=Lates japonicus TaxID=270547 RepID=A0AAD3NN26_LATJO|nr:cell division cycle 42, like [Lates japonicus]
MVWQYASPCSLPAQTTRTSVPCSPSTNQMGGFSSFPWLLCPTTLPGPGVSSSCSPGSPLNLSTEQPPSIHVKDTPPLSIINNNSICDPAQLFTPCGFLRFPDHCPRMSSSGGHTGGPAGRQQHSGEAKKNKQRPYILSGEKLPPELKAVKYVECSALTQRTEQHQVSCRAAAVPPQPGLLYPGSGNTPARIHLEPAERFLGLCFRRQRCRLSTLD